MNIFKTTGISVCLVLSSFALNAQKVSIQTGGKSRVQHKKGTESINFVANGNNYFITSVFESAITKYYLEGFSSSGAVLAQTSLEISPGVFNNSYGIDEVISLGNTAYALVEHLDKPAGKNSLLARVIEPSGTISKNEVELMSMSFEKTMNSGFNNAVVSPDNNVLAVVSQLPYVKDQSAKIKIAVFDKTLQKTNSHEVTIPGEDTKNKSIRIAVGNDGTVYLIKQTSMKNGEIILAVYQYSGTADLKEYTFEMTAPNYFYNYTYVVNPANELVIGGTYYERKTVSVGDKKALGIFYFTNKGKSEKVFKTFTLDSPVESLTARKILFSGNTVFLAAEQYREEKISPPTSAAGTSAAFDYSYNLTHKNEYVIAMDADGNKKFELNMAKDFTVRDFDKQHLSAYFICNDKLTVIYNDQAKKYTSESRYGHIIPVLVQINTDGLMQSPVVFKDELKLPEYFILYPAVSVQNGKNELSMLMKNHEFSQYLNVKID